MKVLFDALRCAALCRCQNAAFSDGYGNSIDRSAACSDTSKSVFLTVADACPCKVSATRVVGLGSGPCARGRDAPQSRRPPVATCPLCPQYPNNESSNKRWCCGDDPSREHIDVTRGAFSQVRFGCARSDCASRHLGGRPGRGSAHISYPAADAGVPCGGGGAARGLSVRADAALALAVQSRACSPHLVPRVSPPPACVPAPQLANLNLGVIGVQWRVVDCSQVKQGGSYYPSTPSSSSSPSSSPSSSSGGGGGSPSRGWFGGNGGGGGGGGLLGRIFGRR